MRWMRDLGPRLPSFVTPARLVGLFAGLAGSSFVAWWGAGSPGSWPGTSSGPRVVAFVLGAVLFGLAARRVSSNASSVARAAVAGAVYAGAMFLSALEGPVTLTLQQVPEAVVTLVLMLGTMCVLGALLSVGLAPFVAAAASPGNLAAAERVGSHGGLWLSVLGVLGVLFASALHLGRTHELDRQAYAEMVTCLPAIGIGLISASVAFVLSSRRRAWLGLVARGEVGGFRLDAPSGRDLPRLDGRAGRPMDLVRIATPEGLDYRSPAASRLPVARVHL
jgi:hypothetical protein